jgi:uncharacterized cupredoxin-like copper-binding protein
MRRTLTIAGTVLLAASVAGCGSSSTSHSGPMMNAPVTGSSTDLPKAVSPALTVAMSEFAFSPNNASAQAGRVTITARNDGKVVHELVVLKTNADPAQLPMKGAKVDESTSVGEIADVEAGATKKVTLKLAPGKYVMVCALPGHYQGGMYGSITVK